jgi:hypothetical protein
MSRDAARKLLSSAFVAACGLSVVAALIPLALVLFFVVSQGVPAYSAM